MDMMDSVADMFGKGASAVAEAVSGAAIESKPFMAGFARMCNDGWLQGWHERNGGNLSYRMTDEEASSSKPYFNEAGKWVSAGVQADNLSGAYFVVTGSGSSMRNVQSDLVHNVGIVEVNDAGDAYRIVWGLKDGGVPTSELSSHFMSHSVRMQATDGACRVVYHAHPDNVIALTKVMPLDARTFTRALWKATTECVIAFPAGVGVVPCMAPGGADIAQATSELMKTYDAAIWAQHGLFASGADFDAAFGLMHTIEKAAAIHARALMLNGGSDEFMNTIADDDLRAIARTYNLALNEDFLD